MPFQLDVVFRLRPWRLGSHEGVEIVEDFAGFDVDLAVQAEQDECGGVGVDGVVVGFEAAVGVGVKDEAVDVLADFGWEGEEVVLRWWCFHLVCDASSSC